MYIVKARYYAESDNFGESYIITSDNSERDTKLEIGQHLDLLPIDPLPQKPPLDKSSRPDKPAGDVCERCWHYRKSIGY